ncbi:MAG TPA: hypothetical protein VEW26_01630 [Allosphingosinicella sp.]|nr:hypothetical protein [Allosphingosinicella sp.]
MLPRVALLLALAPLASCGSPARGAQSGETRTFDVGPSDDPDRIRFTIPAPYLEREPDLRDLTTTRPSLTVLLADFDPAPASRRGDPATGYLRVGWTKEGSIKRRTDGSWLNHYSTYNEPAPDLLGMKRRLTAHRRFGDNSFLLVEPPGNTMIVCEQLVSRVPMVCTMAAEYEKGLLIELSFDPVHLTEWKQLRRRAEAFVRPRVAFGEQTPLGW